MKFLFFILLLTMTAVGAQETKPDAQIYIKLGDAQTKKSLMAFPSLQFLGNPATAPNYQSVGSELYRVILNDLSISPYFQFIAQSAFLEDVSKTSPKPFPGEPNGFKFESWKQIGAEFLIRATYQIAGDSVTLETYTYHVPKAQVILAKRYKGTIKNTRRVAHSFANDVLEALTGKTGMYLSKAVVASDRGGGGFREIYILDWDGADFEKITNHKSVALSPTWSPDATKIAYTAFVQRSKTKTRNADMFVYDVSSGKRQAVSFRQGINSGADFTADGNLLLTLSQSGTPDIYKLDLNGNLMARLTNGPRGAMNVEPAMSADGKRVAFSSDRSGQPMLYVMDSDGSNVKRLTFAGKYNATPAWSPDGKKIAFCGWAEDHFDVFVMNADGSDMVRITSAKKPNGKWADNEAPVFSPDGRLLMYTSNRTINSQIYISNLDGSEERRITNDSHNYFKPKWSKNIE